MFLILLFWKFEKSKNILRIPCSIIWFNKSNVFKLRPITIFWDTVIFLYLEYRFILNSSFDRLEVSSNCELFSLVSRIFYNKIFELLLLFLSLRQTFHCRLSHVICKIAKRFASKHSKIYQGTCQGLF